MSKKIIVAYSGGLDTSVLLLWLKNYYNAEVIAYCADVGQEEELDGLEEKALNTGASKCFIGDLKDEFAKDFIFPMFQAGAIYEGKYWLGTSIARPVITMGMIDVAIQEGAKVLCLSDSKGLLHFKDGLKDEDLQKIKTIKLQF